MVGFDSGKAQIDAIRDGLMIGAITQNPVGIGYETVKAAVEAIKGKELPKTIDTGYYWYDKIEHRRRGDPGRPLRVGNGCHEGVSASAGAPSPCGRARHAPASVRPSVSP